LRCSDEIDPSSVADPVSPKEGPLVPSVGHLKGVNGDPLPTGITNCRSRRMVEDRTQDGQSTAVEWMGWIGGGGGTGYHGSWIWRRHTRKSDAG
jgi:hypothetical protein